LQQELITTALVEYQLICSTGKVYGCFHCAYLSGFGFTL